MKKLFRKLFGKKDSKPTFSVGGRSVKCTGIDWGKSFNGSQVLKVDWKPIKKELKEIKELLIKIDSKL